MNSGAQPNGDPTPDNREDSDIAAASQSSSTSDHSNPHEQHALETASMDHDLAAAEPDTRQLSQNGRSPRSDDLPPAMRSELATAPMAVSTAKSPPATLVILVGVLLVILGLAFSLSWLTLIGALLTLVLAWGLIWPSLSYFVAELSPQQRSLIVAIPAAVIGAIGLTEALGINQAIRTWALTLRWDILGSFGDFLGAIGQIFVALLALFVAWRQYIISRDLTLQQNRITQQQTIDAYFQGISELVLDDEGLLEDWPQERIIAEARTAAILSSIDAPGKAKIIRFLSRSRLLTPLKRDEHLGRPILDGHGGYAEDRNRGVRVINLGAILANANLSGSDLRWTDLSDVNLIRADLSRCDLVRANFSRTILYQASLAEADLMGVTFFYGTAKSASPRSRLEPPNFSTGEHTGAVIEDVDFSGAKRMSDEQRQYCCRWGGDTTRATIPGGCEGIPNCLGR
ncbi:pentapeptide repeat-containing protein [Leptolyngbya iicbica]|uniref:Pentapeptide repeat-containing protein n=2 Tax=Cyanophyceae TaxID=3028117 RepID=A0A4Q7E324_9CYAN|nr:pentapeptide repeat-containing protein [Leptolyngbya sp. LK]RZM76023.1 pentapeptide repeat-containing protein [Leptolyngbya sp. LK]